MSVWIIVGATRGIGLEFVGQLLSRGNIVVATFRECSGTAGQLSLMADGWPERCRLVECDVASEQSIVNFVDGVKSALSSLQKQKIDHVVVTAGVFKWPNRATEISFNDFTYHMNTNAIGPIITAQKLLQTGIPITAITFISSDSGSAGRFRGFEDGFAAYSASKAALNQMLRHMAAELKRKDSETTILAMHPGEVETDMGSDATVTWEVSSPILAPGESVRRMLEVIESRSRNCAAYSGSFWTWQGKEYPW